MARSHRTTPSPLLDSALLITGLTIVVLLGTITGLILIAAGMAAAALLAAVPNAPAQPVIIPVAALLTTGSLLVATALISPGRDLPRELLASAHSSTVRTAALIGMTATLLLTILRPVFPWSLTDPQLTLASIGLSLILAAVAGITHVRAQ